MIIKSQDKESIVNFSNVESLDIHKYRVDERKAYADDENPNTFYIGYVGLSSEICWLGRYATKKKAIKVLDDIAHNYAFEQSISSNQFCGGQITLTPNVFEMPQDEDVTV